MTVESGRGPRYTAAMQLMRFLMVGVLNTLVGLGCIWLLLWAGATPVLANAAGFLIGMAVSFSVNRRWTFEHRGDWRASLGRWLLVAGIAYAANLGVMLGLTRLLGVDPYLAQIPGIAAYTLLSYLGAKVFVFAR